MDRVPRHTEVDRPLGWLSASTSESSEEAEDNKVIMVECSRQLQGRVKAQGHTEVM